MAEPVAPAREGRCCRSDPDRSAARRAPTRRRPGSRFWAWITLSPAALAVVASPSRSWHLDPRERRRSRARWSR